MSKIITASLPFIAVLLFVLAIITYVPWFSLALLK
jgi:TRAP-type C4-dicarboxylate transport system permease large subunit